MISEALALQSCRDHELPFERGIASLHSIYAFMFCLLWIETQDGLAKDHVAHRDSQGFGALQTPDAVL